MKYFFNNYASMLLQRALMEKVCLSPHLEPQLILVKGRPGIIICFTGKEIEAGRGDTISL